MNTKIKINNVVPGLNMELVPSGKQTYVWIGFGTKCVGDIDGKPLLQLAHRILDEFGATHAKKKRKPARPQASREGNK